MLTETALCGTEIDSVAFGPAAVGSDAVLALDADPTRNRGADLEAAGVDRDVTYPACERAAFR